MTILTFLPEDFVRATVDGFTDVLMVTTSVGMLNGLQNNIIERVSVEETISGENVELYSSARNQL